MGRAALCVGINEFANYPQAALQGCVNDARDMKALLQELMGFGRSDVQVLVDADATKANIVGRLEEMVAGARAGKYEYLVFSFSSHGTQVPDLDGDEPDRADEAFCPHDLAQKGNAWDPKHIITDDELNRLFGKLPAGVPLEVWLDTCHSGSGLKAVDLLLDRRPRFLPPPSLEAFRAIEGRASRGLKDLVREQRELPHQILWAACRADQTSADARFGRSWHGAFTYFLAKELRASANRLSRAELLKRIRADLAAGGYTQSPQLECAATARKAATAAVAA